MLIAIAAVLILTVVTGLVLALGAVVDGMIDKGDN
jgi:hypothetical protein